jgi:glycosyltransferase involved in cell wall biosynthesis
MKMLAQSISGLELIVIGTYGWSELDELLTDVDCAIAPSIVPETFGMAPREALIRGIPVLVSKLGALPEVVREGINGHVFDPQSRWELARLLMRLANDSTHLSWLKNGAAVTRVLTVSEHVSNLREVFQRAIEQSQTDSDESSCAEAQETFTELLRLGF